MLGFGLAIEPQLWALVFVMVRVGSAFITAPVFGNMSVPLPVRVALSGAIGVLVLASHPIQPPAQIFAVATFLAIAAEAMVGLALGFVLQIAFAAPLVAGEIIGGSMGIGFANMIDPNSGRSSPAIGQFLSIMLTLLFLSLDGHLVLVDMILKSYAAMPPGEAWLTTTQMRDIAFFGGYAFLAGLLLALPVGCCASTSSSGCCRAPRPRSTCSRSGCRPALASGSSRSPSPSPRWVIISR